MNYWIVKGHNRAKGWENEWRQNITRGSQWPWKTGRHSRVQELVKGDRVLFWECAPGSRFVGLGEIEAPFKGRNKAGKSVFGIVTVTEYLTKTLAKSDLIQISELRDAAFLKHGQGDAFLAVRPLEAEAIFRRLAKLNPELRLLWPDLDDAAVTREKPEFAGTTIAEFEAVEGNTKLVEHLRRERNRELVSRKKAETLQRCGRLECEVCGFDFEVFYGVVGQGFCEAHHLVPLAELDETRTAKLCDLAVVCANCHRMLHRRNPPMTLPELRTQLRKKMR